MYFSQKSLRITVPQVHEISITGHWQDQYNQLSRNKHMLHKSKAKLHNLINKVNFFIGGSAEKSGGEKKTPQEKLFPLFVTFPE